MILPAALPTIGAAITRGLRTAAIRYLTIIKGV